MTDAVAALAAVFNQMNNLVKSLVQDQLTNLVSGTAKVVVLAPGQQVVDPLPGLDDALKKLKAATPEEIAQLNDGSLKVRLLPRGSRIITPLNIREIATQVRSLHTADDILLALERDGRLDLPRLRRLADELNITLPGGRLTKPAAQLYLAQKLAAYNDRNPSS
ncbi:hypothetical protein J2S43_005379 [Catenuloplanes nepalensis]|uniref:Uncharacterized protein n=1 Tax=Catenuloplanes nepalensis TaxID=587533 RepID=A0ABT9MZJ0_9ACTN|nr:hypothetical protein [Catenuloplanes nepalensis]MDP9796867.1 hypothetical protein [Catenuloplanes nepalensis]